MRRGAIAAAVALLAAVAAGQSLVRGIPPSVTSLGASHSGNIPASITSLRSVPLCCDRAGRSFSSHFGLAFRGAPVFFTPVILPMGLPVLPTIYDYGMDPLVMPEELQQVKPVARRASDEDRYRDYYLSQSSRRSEPPEASTPAPKPAATSPEPAKPQPITVLIFRDGHKVEIRNYAISGNTLFNLSDEGPHKVSLDDLDLGATTKANDERGIEFHLPKRT